MTTKNDKHLIPCFTCSYAVPLRTDKNGRAFYKCPRCLLLALCRINIASDSMRGLSFLHSEDNYKVEKIKIPQLGKWTCPTCGTKIYEVDELKNKKNLRINYKYYCRDCGLLIFWNDVKKELLA